MSSSVESAVVLAVDYFQLKVKYAWKNNEMVQIYWIENLLSQEPS